MPDMVLFGVSSEGGFSLVRAPSADAARRHLAHELIVLHPDNLVMLGHNLSTIKVRPATEAQIDWAQSMGAFIMVCGPEDGEHADDAALEAAILLAEDTEDEE